MASHTAADLATAARVLAAAARELGLELQDVGPLPAPASPILADDGTAMASELREPGFEHARPASPFDLDRVAPEPVATGERRAPFDLALVEPELAAAGRHRAPFDLERELQYDVSAAASEPASDVPFDQERDARIARAA
jgi:hypothetical protein